MLTFNKIKEKGEEIKNIINQNVSPDNIYMTDTASKNQNVLPDNIYMTDTSKKGLLQNMT
jgi:hypothetical protein